MSKQYIIQKRAANSDFLIAETKKARILDIIETKEGATLEIKVKNDDDPIFTIPIRNIIETDVVSLKLYHKTDMLIQIIFIERNQHLRIMRLNIRDDQIDDLNNEIHDLILKNNAFY